MAKKQEQIKEEKIATEQDDDYKEKLRPGSPEDYISRVSGSGHVLFKERLKQQEQK